MATLFVLRQSDMKVPSGLVELSEVDQVIGNMMQAIVCKAEIEPWILGDYGLFLIDQTPAR